MKLGSLTCTRGDEREIFRPELLRGIEKQDLKIDVSIMVDYPPISDKNDLFDRFKIGVKTAIDYGVDWLYVFEDDDYYSKSHAIFLRNHGDFAMSGVYETVYYHLKFKGHRLQKHYNRASLFATAFNPRGILPFLKDKKDSKYLDVELWDWAHKNHLNMNLIPNNLTCMGMKHGIGLCGGNGHYSMSYATDDAEQSYLQNRVDPTAFEFYRNLNL